MIRYNRLLTVMMFLFCMTSIQSQSIFGKWKTVDDRNGVVKAIVELYEKDGKMQGKVLKIMEKGKENMLCGKCEGDLKDKPINGMQIIYSFEETEEGVYRGKKLFDPEQAMTFKGKVWLDPEDSDKLKVRGYLAFLYRTQTWIRVKN